MLKQPLIEKLAAMRLLGMAEALKAQEQDPTARELSFLERFGLLVDQQWTWRENQALSRRLKNAKLRTPNACVEEIDYRTARGLDKSVIRSLTQQAEEPKRGAGRCRRRLLAVMMAATRMVGILVHGDNHFIVHGRLPDRESAIALVRRWSLIQIGATVSPDLDGWQIVSREFRENLKWAVVIPSEREINPAVAALLAELAERGVTIHDAQIGFWQ